MSNKSDRNRQIVALSIVFLIILCTSIIGAMKRGLNTNNYAIFFVLLVLPIIAGILLWKRISKLRRENHEEDEIKKQLNR